MSQISFSKPKYLLNIKIISSDEEVIKYYNNFTSHHNGDAGIDLYNFDSMCIKNFDVGTIDYKIQCEMINIKNNEFCCYDLVPRSSISKTPFQMANSIGIIDAGYRGNIMAKIRCFSHSTEYEELKPGAYFQIVAPDRKPIKVQVVSELSKTSRDTGGFGSTNK